MVKGVAPIEGIYIKDARLGGPAHRIVEAVSDWMLVKQPIQGGVLAVEIGRQCQVGSNYIGHS